MGTGLYLLSSQKIFGGNAVPLLVKRLSRYKKGVAKLCVDDGLGDHPLASNDATI
jgi:hypothetical protein